MNEHYKEADRIQNEIDNLGPEFAQDGIVRTILNRRVNQEKTRGLEQDRQESINTELGG